MTLTLVRNPWKKFVQYLLIFGHDMLRITNTCPCDSVYMIWAKCFDFLIHKPYEHDEIKIPPFSCSFWKILNMLKIKKYILIGLLSCCILASELKMRPCCCIFYLDIVYTEYRCMLQLHASMSIQWCISDNFISLICSIFFNVQNIYF